MIEPGWRSKARMIITVLASIVSPLSNATWPPKIRQAPLRHYRDARSMVVTKAWAFMSTPPSQGSLAVLGCSSPPALHETPCWTKTYRYSFNARRSQANRTSSSQMYRMRGQSCAIAGFRFPTCELAFGSARPLLEFFTCTRYPVQ